MPVIKPITDINIEAYDELVNANKIDQAIFDAKQEVANGAELQEAKTALLRLRRKHFG